MCNKMSDVRLSNASPTVERVDARQPDNVRPPVRRNLFGSPDREELRRYMTATIQDEVRGFAERYNFDAVNNRPLSPGNFEWQEDLSAPEFYRRPPHGSLPGDERQDAAAGAAPRPPLVGDAAGTSERGSGRLKTGDSSRKRSSPCSSECQSKRSHTDEEDDGDPPKGAGSQAVQVAAEGDDSAEDL